MSVLGVVPGKEDLEIVGRVLRTGEVSRGLWRVCERLELAFRIRVVIRNVGPAEAGQDIEIHQ